LDLFHQTTLFFKLNLFLKNSSSGLGLPPHQSALAPTQQMPLQQSSSQQSPIQTSQQPLQQQPQQQQQQHQHQQQMPHSQPQQPQVSGKIFRVFVKYPVNKLIVSKLHNFGLLHRALLSAATTALTPFSNTARYSINTIYKY